MPKSKEERIKAIRAFLKVHPDWDISIHTRCLTCARQHPHSRIGLNFCEHHRFANEKWLASDKGYDKIAVLASRDQKLKDALEAEDSWHEEEQEESPLHLATDLPGEVCGLPIEANGWGEFVLERERVSIIIVNMAEFTMRYHCLLAPNFDLDRHIAALIKKLDCPVKKERAMCPCHEAAHELEKNGHSSCGVFVTERYLQQGQHADHLLSSKERTQALLKRYKIMAE